MNMQEIRALARERGLKTGNIKKADLVRVIQRDEGNFDCFGRAAGGCDQQQCLWRADCLPSPKAKTGRQAA